MLPKLTHLDLGDNEIKIMHSEDLKNLVRLDQFKLDGNFLTSLHDSTFTHQPYLRTLNLARNHISKISKDTFVGANNLTVLDMSHNKFDRLDFLLPILDTLETFVLNGNRFKYKSLEELSNMIVLKELRLSDCGLADINTKIFPDSLSLLDLSGNHLSALPKDSLPPNLTELNISRNRFRGLPDDVLTILENTQTLSLENNQWSCDLCHIVPLLDRINRNIAYREIICSTPYVVKGKN